MRVLGRLAAAASLALAVGFMAVASASAQTYTGVTPPVIPGASVAAAGLTSPASQAQAGQALHIASTQSSQRGTASVSSLPFTGADVAGLVTIAGVLVLSGLFITRRARNRSAS